MFSHLHLERRVKRLLTEGWHTNATEAWVEVTWIHVDQEDELTWGRICKMEKFVFAASSSHFRNTKLHIFPQVGLRRRIPAMTLTGPFTKSGSNLCISPRQFGSSVPPRQTPIFFSLPDTRNLVLLPHYRVVKILQHFHVNEFTLSWSTKENEHQIILSTETNERHIKVQDKVVH